MLVSYYFPVARLRGVSSQCLLRIPILTEAILPKALDWNMSKSCYFTSFSFSLPRRSVKINQIVVGRARKITSVSWSEGLSIDYFKVAGR